MNLSLFFSLILLSIVTNSLSQIISSDLETVCLSLECFPLSTSPIVAEEEAILEEAPLESEEDIIQEEELSLIDAISCPQNRSLNCTGLSIAPVCAVNCLNGTCSASYNNECEACADFNVLSYSAGVCEKDKIYCPISSVDPFDVSCVGEFNPVCAYPFGCDDQSCATSAGNICEACVFFFADYYTLGICPGETSSEIQ